MTDLSTLTIMQAHEGLKKGDFSATELTQAVIDVSKAKNDDLNVFITPSYEQALSKAAQVDAKIKAGDEIAPLAGIPASLKDVVCTKGIRTTAASHLLENYVPPFDAVVWERLQAQDAISIGKANTDEFTCGVSTETSYFGVTKNPHDTERVPGGSSGGSAAAVAANMSMYSIGTDTGGSIRQPAHFCGVVGLKVTYGRVPRSGVISMASSFDTIGPLTKTVEDAALVLEAIAGTSPKDQTTPPVAVDNYRDYLGASIEGKIAGVPKEFMDEGVSSEVKEAVMQGIKQLESMGMKIVEISLPMVKYAVACYYVLTPSEVSANMSRYDGIRYGLDVGSVNELDEIYLKVREQGFGEEMKRRILMGTYVLSAGYYDAYYKKAQKIRTKIIQDFNNAFKQCDVIVGPVAPTSAFKIGAQNDDPIAMYMEDILTVPASAAGIPGLSVPLPRGAGQLPVGFQIMGPMFAEKEILNVGHHLEQSFR